MSYALDSVPQFAGKAGRRWFRHYVADPIPDHLSNLTGGYRGDTSRGIIITMFDFQPPFERFPFPKDWEPTDVGPAVIALANIIEANTGIRLSISCTYLKPNATGGGSTWLVVDEDQRVGALYEAGFCPSQNEVTED